MRSVTKMQLKSASSRGAVPAICLGFLIIGALFANGQTVTNTPPKIAPQAADGNGNGNGGGSDNGKAKGKDKPAIAERPTVIPRAQPEETNSEKGKGKPEKPERPNNPQPPAEVKALVDKFQDAREKYLKTQRDLRLLQRDASEEERTVIREQLKEQLERWKETIREKQKEMKDRIQDMKSEVQPELGKVIDQAKEEGRGR
jgi:hypothetical protein